MAYYFEPLLQKDLRALHASGLIEGSLSAQREVFGKSQRLFSVKRFVLWREEGTERKACLLAELWPLQGSTKQVSLQLKWTAELEGASDGEDSYLPILSEGLRLHFLAEGYWRVSFAVLQEAGVLEKRHQQLCRTIGFKLDGVLQDYAEGASGPLNAVHWSWLLRDPQHSQVFFLPFGSGLLVAKGMTEAVESIRFHAFGSPCEEAVTLLWGRTYALVDEQRCFSEVVGFDYSSQTNQLRGAMEVAFSEIQAYLNGKLTKLSFPVAEVEASAFQKAVWRSLAKIPYGETRSYLDIARQVSGLGEREAKKLCRAVGAACSANPLCIAVPCHRVLGSDLSLTGFSGGVQFKGDLLNLEIWGVKPN